VISVDAKKTLPAQPLEPWQKPDQDITLAASRKGSFDSHVSAEKGPKAISGLACQRYNVSAIAPAFTCTGSACSPRVPDISTREPLLHIRKLNLIGSE